MTLPHRLEHSGTLCSVGFMLKLFLWAVELPNVIASS